MIDYKNGKIYRLVCNTTGDQYIGSTTQPLSQRLGGHKRDYKRFLAGKITYQVTSFSILSNNNFEMILLEEFACENKNQLERRERYYIESMKCVNKIKPAQTKEEKIEYHKQYCNENKEELKEQMKQYYHKNKEEHKEQMKQYYHKNQEKLTALIKCECGGQYQHYAKSIHFKSLKHKKWATPEI